MASAPDPAPAAFEPATRRWLVTGAAGFIGAHLGQRLGAIGAPVVGVDSFSAYYDPDLKSQRVEALVEAIPIEKLDVSDAASLEQLFADFRPQVVVHLAAQAGVRFSLDDPESYLASNLTAFGSLLEAVRAHPVEHLVFASSSSVYGSTGRLPFSTDDPADHPLNLYAASKRSNELMAHAYSHLFDIPTTGLRFFTVYGPWGRPDMAYFAFADAMLAGRPLRLFGDGSARRDFTYVDDIVDGLVLSACRPPNGPTAHDGETSPGTSAVAPWQLFNIGHGDPVTINALIAALERALGVEAVRHTEASPPGEASATHADVRPLEEHTGARPHVTLDDGIERFVRWFRAWRNT